MPCERWGKDTTDPATPRRLDFAGASLGVGTSNVRGPDRLGFKAVSMPALGEMLRAAYEAGLAAGRGGKREPSVTLLLGLRPLRRWPA